VVRGNLHASIARELPEELVTVLARGRDVRIERIVSRGHVSPPGFWYDQDEDEIVVLVSGCARIEVEGQGEIALAPLDWLDLPAHQRHRVSFTDTESDTVWLAIFFRR
jgi:cupin 2 domain-containing protein